MTMQEGSRREFLARAGLAAPVLAGALRAGAAESPAVRVAMIGDRGHNGYVLDGLKKMPEARVTGLAAGGPDDGTAKLEKWCKEQGHTPQVFEDYRKMLDTVEPDVVTVCGPFELHASMCVEAFERGIPVFCEKLAATTLDDYARLKAAQEKAGVHFATMMGLRYEPAFYTAAAAVRRGAIGEPRLAHAQKSYVLGNRADYYRQRETSSGLICWVGSHAVDMIYWFCGLPFQRVTAVQSSEGNHGLGDLEMTALCQFTMAGQTFATASLDYLRPANGGSHGDDRIRVAGDKGVIEVRDGEVYLINDEAKGEQRLDPACDRQIFKDFVLQAMGQGEAILGAKDVFAVTEACLYAREAADTGRVMEIS